MLKRLEKIPLVFCGTGPSVNILAENMIKLRGKNVLFGGLNNIGELEKVLGLQVDIIYYAALGKTEIDRKEIKEYINRNNNLFITNSEGVEDLGLPKKENILVSDWGYGFNSLFAFLLTLGRMSLAKRIYLVGFDGGVEKHGDDIYFSKNIHCYGYDGNLEAYKKDADIFSKVYPLFSEYRGFTLEISILTGSRISCFPEKSIDEIIKEIE